MDAAMASATRMTVAESAAQERLPVDLKQRKVSPREGGILYIITATLRHTGRAKGKKWGPFFGPIFETALPARKRNRGRKSVSIFQE